MISYAARRRCTLICGNQGSGKTTFALRYLVACREIAVRFIFDPDGEYSDRLKLPAAETVEELSFAVEDGFVLFDPAAMFGSDRTAGFAWFCAFAFGASLQLAGRKALMVDEVWKYCSPQAIPVELADCLQMGRKRELETIFATQRPHLVNGSITNEVSELVAFRVQEPAALERLKHLGVSPAQIMDLPPGSFVAVNTDSGAVKSGKLF